MNLKSVRRLLLGAPLNSGSAMHQRLSKIIALPVFSSDALSSVAYGPQEAMIGLAAAGSIALGYSLWLILVIVGLLAILTTSYNQTIHAYPGGGGSYIVARDNLGTRAAEIAGVALLTDYTLTVAVSVASGIDAILSAYPALDHLPTRLGLNVCATLFIMLMNLRGVRESGAAFALPTYLFIGSFLFLIGLGGWQIAHGGMQHVALTPKTLYKPVEGLSLLLILRSFANGCTALTGVEAISNGIPAFRPPESRNASITMIWMAVILGSMLIGETYLAKHLVALNHLALSDTGETVPSQIAHAVFGSDFRYYLVQWATFLILIIAANTSFADFPRLSAIAAKDRHLPRWMGLVGDRLVYQNGIIVLATLSIILQLAFKGDTNQLIPLYAIGVYMAFTLSQSGMVVRWFRLKSSGWKWRAAVNGTGAFFTAIVVVVFSIVKFSEGAWVVLVIMPILILLLIRIDRHYTFIAERLKIRDDEQRTVRTNAALLLVARWDAPTMAALEYARLAFPEIRILHWFQNETTAKEVEMVAKGYARDVPVSIGRNTAGGWPNAVGQELQRLASEHPDRWYTVLLPATLHQRPGGHLDKMAAWSLKWKLLHLPGAAVADVSTLVLTDALKAKAGLSPVPAVSRYRPREAAPQNGAPASPSAPSKPRSLFDGDRHRVLLLVPGIHRGILEAIDYARQVGRGFRGLHIEMEPEYTERIRDGWEKWAAERALIIMDSPYRQLREPLVHYVETTRLQERTEVLTVILPEFVARKWWNKVLHNQSGLLLKFALHGQPNVVVINTRYFID